jgi:hypothetical protein
MIFQGYRKRVEIKDRGTLERAKPEVARLKLLEDERKELLEWLDRLAREDAPRLAEWVLSDQSDLVSPVLFSRLMMSNAS